MTKSRSEAGPPLVSVLMPCFDHESYVAPAVESVWSQSHRPLELIAVDDGSRDRTFAVLEEMATRSPLPMSVRRIRNRGIAGALNVALEQARGEWISVLASDDAYVEDKVARQLAAASRRPGCIAVHSDYLCIGPDGDPAGAFQGSRLPPAEGEAHRDLLHGLVTMHSVTMMIRREALAALGGWDECYAQEDWPLILRLSRRGTIAYCVDKLVLRRVHPLNISGVMSRSARFSPDDAGIDLLRELCESRRELEICGSTHVSVVMRNSLARRGWRRAGGAFAYAWRHYPSRRPYLVRQIASGLRSLVWLALARPLLPRPLVERLSAARSGHLASRAITRRAAAGDRETTDS